MALALVLVAAASPARAEAVHEVRALYQSFATAQNAQDLAKVRSLLWDSPQFLWVSDGRSVWGRDRTIERMASFQKAAVWKVIPDLDQAVVVDLDEATAFIHLPLDLSIGANFSPDRLPWLVSVLCTKTDAGWKIAALFTTPRK